MARVCKNDKGGPHQFRDRWTSFLKARLNCSVPGEYPFYFDEIRKSFLLNRFLFPINSYFLESTSDIVEGKYGTDDSQQIIYGTLTTPTNAIGGSAICAYSMKDILEAFEGTFKHQESINSNWLPVPNDKVDLLRYTLFVIAILNLFRGLSEASESKADKCESIMQRSVI